MAGKQEVELEVKRSRAMSVGSSGVIKVIFGGYRVSRNGWMDR